VTTPLDVVKTRLMTQSAGDEGRYKGVVDTFRRILKEEGAAALFRGIGPRVMWISLGGSIFFGAFEELSRRMRGGLGLEDHSAGYAAAEEGAGGSSGGGAAASKGTVTAVKGGSA